KDHEDFNWGGITNAAPGFINAGIGLWPLGRDDAFFIQAVCPEATFAAILREILGNPFRPALVQCGGHLAVLTNVSLAQVQSQNQGNLWLGSGSELVYDTAAPAAWMSWAGGTIPRLVQAIYAERSPREGDLDSGRMAVLADALEEAGCVNQEILAHCRA